ncbi:hypothetical protein [Streptomyces sp. C]|uniref:hypothetical protein n=1 Tax=Streptomyces sp. C TaxID=253839 RepID=UPI0001B56883|nr:hypothetical protein [Streptomyces sp. C]EFL19226.1 conserved hypothetical protein [Streptomyces sp. C]
MTPASRPPDRGYRYVGPGELRALVRPGGEGRCVRSAADLHDWLRAAAPGERAEPFTYVVDGAGVLRLAPRRSEHVACAAGGPVLAAGEMGFREESGQWRVDAVSNQSTGYCPDTGSWADLAAALDTAGIAHPAGFTHPVVFRRCPGCREVNIVREGDFVCLFCDAELPRTWNVDGDRAPADRP